MSAIDSDFGFDAIFRKSANELKLRLARDVASDQTSQLSPRRGGLAALAIFSGLGLLSLGIFLIGYSALISDTPEVWIHRLMALAIAQSILIGAVTMKLMPVIERRSASIRIRPIIREKSPASMSRKGAPARIDPVPPPLPAPPEPIVGGRLAGREFLQYDDGSIEIDTLVGRRRFVSLDAAKEFVGS